MGSSMLLRIVRYAALPMLHLAASCSYPALPPLPVDEGDAGPDAPPVAAEPASCKDLADTCGPSGTDDCCTSLEVPGGTFFRHYDNAGDSMSGDTIYPATVSGFFLDKYEVTVGRYRAFVNAGMGTQNQPPSTGSGAHPHILHTGWRVEWNSNLPVNSDALIASVQCSPGFNTWTRSPGANEVRPMNCLSWELAMAFCIWDGGYLPTATEWSYAAAGGSEQRAYPWSVPANNLSINPTLASYAEASNCPGDGLPACTLEDIRPVGSKVAGNGRWGHSDLGGNLAEFMLDGYENDSSICIDCVELDQLGGGSILRGGSFYMNRSELRTSRSTALNVGFSKFYIGFRCARPAS